MTRIGSVVAMGALVCGVYASAQSAISAHSGMVHYVEGKVLLEGEPVDPKFGEFPEVKNNQVLETAEGRAEVLLTPGVFLRIAENSSFKMLSNKLSDTALEALSGSMIIEVDELLKDNAITIRYKDSTIALDKQGLYRVDTASERLRVYDGEAAVTYGLKTIQARKGKQVDLGDGLLASTFDTKDSDSFYRWVERRSEYIATANVSAAHAAGTQGLSASVPCSGVASTSPNPSSFATNGASSYCNPYGNPYGGYGSYGGYSPYGMWAWDPYFGMFTYLPGYGYGYSPFGWVYYSPVTVGSLYQPGAYGTRTPGATAVANNRTTGPTALAGSRPAAATATATAATASRANGSASPVSSSAASRSSSASSSGGSVSSSAGRASGGMSSGGGRR